MVLLVFCRFPAEHSTRTGSMLFSLFPHGLYLTIPSHASEIWKISPIPPPSLPVWQATDKQGAVLLPLTPVQLQSSMTEMKISLTDPFASGLPARGCQSLAFSSQAMASVSRDKRWREGAQTATHLSGCCFQITASSVRGLGLPASQ